MNDNSAFIPVGLCFIVLALTGLNPAFAGVGLVFVILGLSGRKNEQKSCIDGSSIQLLAFWASISSGL